MDGTSHDVMTYDELKSKFPEAQGIKTLRKCAAKQTPFQISSTLTKVGRGECLGIHSRLTPSCHPQATPHAHHCHASKCDIYHMTVYTKKDTKKEAAGEEASDSGKHSSPQSSGAAKKKGKPDADYVLRALLDRLDKLKTIAEQDGEKFINLFCKVGAQGKYETGLVNNLNCSRIRCVHLPGKVSIAQQILAFDAAKKAATDAAKHGKDPKEAASAILSKQGIADESVNEFVHER